MKMRREQGVPGRMCSQPREFRHVRMWMPLLLVAALVMMLMGCGGAKQQPPRAEQGAMEGTESGTPSPIALSWDPQNACVTFRPDTTRIHVGDQVQFQSSLSDTVLITVAAGLFSTDDTTFAVVRGANLTSPTARALGTYMLTSNPGVCGQDMEGGGPSIIVDSGTE